MNTDKLILLTGGPGSGKTTLIDFLSTEGHCCYPEISRDIILEAQKDGVDQLFLTEPTLFSKRLLEGRVNQYLSAVTESSKHVFIDRGIPDVVAYLNFKNITCPSEFIETCEKHKYHKVFLFPPWKDIYVSDNERYESFEEAQEIHNHIVKTYKGFGYQLIEVPHDTVEKRMQFIIKNI